jgi:hypothetical protein
MITCICGMGITSVLVQIDRNRLFKELSAFAVTAVFEDALV